MSNLLDRANKILSTIDNQQKASNQIHIEFDSGYQYSIFYSDESGNPQKNIYRPTPTGLKLHQDKNSIKAVVGPYGSGKSVMHMSDMLMKFRDMPVCKDGIKYRRSLMMRTTYPKLQKTTIKTFMAWFSQLGTLTPGRLKKYNEKNNDFICRFRYFDKERNEYAMCQWEVIFMALESINDAEKLGSLEVTDIFFNEARDFIFMLFDLGKGRKGRYPEKKMFSDDPDYEPNYPNQVNLDTNACNIKHWFYRDFAASKLPGYSLYKQPPAVLDAPETEEKYITNPEAENLKNLPKNYYTDFVIGKPKIAVEVFAKGNWGDYIEGKRVYPEYNDDRHSVTKIEYVEGQPLYLGWDFGLTPCMVISQLINGQLRAIKEFVSKDMGIENLLEMDILPYWALHNMDKRFPEIYSFADPAGGARSAKNIFEPNLIDIISRKFKKTTAACTNNIEMRLESIRHFLCIMPYGQSGFFLSQEGCPTLREGFNGYYVLMQVNTDDENKRFKEIPDKCGPYSHIQDALQYVAVHLHKSNVYDQEKRQKIASQLQLSGRIP